MPRTAILYIAERCNQSCVFCLEEDGSWREFVDPSTTDVYAMVERLRGRGAQHITFMGGETFFRKDLGRILARAKSVGYTRVGVTTNGTVLSKQGFLRELVASGLDFIEFSVHGHTPELANAIGGTHFTFERQRAALAEVEAEGVPTIVNTVVCRENKDHLVDVARYITTEFPRLTVRFKLKFVSLQGLAAERAHAGAAPLGYDEVDFVSVGDYLAERGIPFWFYNVPLCRLGAHACRAHELATLALDESYFDFDHLGPAEYYDSANQLLGRIWPEPTCPQCSLRPVCPGIEESHRRARASGSLGLAPRSVDPVPLVAFALRDGGIDPSRAAARVAELARQPRPARFVRERPDGAIRFTHPEAPEPLDVCVEARSPEVRAFATTARFALSYRSWSDADPYARPSVARLLKEAQRALERADAAGVSIDEARAAVARAACAGWTAETPRAQPMSRRARGALPVLVDRGDPAAVRRG